MAKKTKEKSETVDVKVSEDLKLLETKRNNLISAIKSKLLSNKKLKTGGSEVRTTYEKEKAYEADIIEINEIGKKLGLAKVSLGSLRS